VIEIFLPEIDCEALRIKIHAGFALHIYLYGISKLSLIRRGGAPPGAAAFIIISTGFCFY
jgi:hypothetical protein